MSLFIIVFLGLCAFGIYSMISDYKKEEKKLSKMNNAEKSKYYREQREREEKAKYNGLKYTCPMCGSHKIKNISTSNRGVSVAMFGASSGKIGKLYECDDCKYKW